MSKISINTHFGEDLCYVQLFPHFIRRHNFLHNSVVVLRLIRFEDMDNSREFHQHRRRFSNPTYMKKTIVSLPSSTTTLYLCLSIVQDIPRISDISKPYSSLLLYGNMKPSHWTLNVCVIILFYLLHAIINIRAASTRKLKAGSRNFLARVYVRTYSDTMKEHYIFIVYIGRISLEQWKLFKTDKPFFCNFTWTFYWMK